jgi:adenylate cyclase
MGDQTVKNIARPVRVYRVRPRLAAAAAGGDLRQTKSRRRAWMAAGAAALVALGAGGSVFWMLRGPAPGPAAEPASVARMAFPLPDKPSIAVLPFDNLSQESGQEYFSDGITEDIITALSKFRALFVIARNSTFVYKGRPVKVQQVAEELGVRYVLEGSVRKAGDRVRISAQLIDASTGHHLWAERFDRALEDVFAVQDEVTQRIVAALAVEVSAAEEKRAMRKDTKNLEAYDYVLRAHQARRSLSQEGIAKAISMYAKAIELDPGYAKAYSYLAWAYLNEWQMGWSDSGARSLERAFELAQKALALDPADPAAHEALGEIYLWQQQFGPAIAETERAVALNPNDADTLSGLADRLAWAGRPEEAVEKIQLAMRLNPNHRFSYSWILGHAYFLLRRYDQAIATLRKVVDRGPDFWPAHIYLAASYSLLGRIEEARAAAAAALRLNPAITTSHSGEQIPYKNPADRKRLFDALEKAGVVPQA